MEIFITQHFQKCLDDIERFCEDTETTSGYRALLEALLTDFVPTLARFPQIGRPFLANAQKSVEAAQAHQRLEQQLLALLNGSSGDLREYITASHVILYLHTTNAVHLIAIRHHQQLSFDLLGHWG